MKRRHILNALKAATGPVEVPTLCRQFQASREDVYSALVSLEALKLAQPVIGEVSRNRYKALGWVARGYH